MIKVDTHIKVVMEMDLEEAKELKSALATFSADHPSDTIYKALSAALETVGA